MSAILKKTFFKKLKFNGNDSCYYAIQLLAKFYGGWSNSSRKKSSNKKKNKMKGNSAVPDKFVIDFV